MNWPFHDPAMLEGFRAVPPGIAVAADGKLYTRLLEVFVKREGRWRIVACHNTAVQPGAAPSGREARTGGG